MKQEYQLIVRLVGHILVVVSKHTTVIRKGYLNMRTIVVAFLFVCVGCAHGVDDDNATVDDAGDETVSDASLQPLYCCQVDHNLVDGQFWQNGLYSCSSTEVPWICGSNMACNDPGCHISMSCDAFNGSGFVVHCPTQDQ